MIPTESLLSKYRVFAEAPSEEEENQVAEYFQGKPLTKGMKWLLRIFAEFKTIYINEEDEELVSNFEMVADCLKDVSKGNAHVFRMEKDIIGLLLKTDTNVRYCPLPFQLCFIDSEIQIDEKTILYGLFLLDIGEPENIKSNHISGMVRVLDKDKWTCYPFMDVVMAEGGPGIDHSALIERIGQDVYVKVRNFVYCFIDFLNTRDVEIIQHTYTEEQKQKARRRGRIPRQSDNIIRITGRTKEYLDSLRQQFPDGIDWTHSFWVRGHFMYLRSQRYRNKRGKKVWRLPHIRGRGALKQKEYLVKAGREGRR